MSVCCGCEGSGHDLSTARGTLDAAGGQGVRSTGSSIRTHARSCFKLVALYW